MTFLRILFWLVAIVAAGLAVEYLSRGLPGQEIADGAAIDLAAAPRPTSVWRLTSLGGEGERCRALLGRAGIGYAMLPPRRSEQECGYRNAVRWTKDGARGAQYAPDAPALSCPLAAALAQWEWSVVQPAAARVFGITVAQIDHLGSYACRRINNRAEGDWSQHAAANAIDIAGFRLADGRRISVVRDWAGDGPEARFLHEVRDGGCRLFGTTLSPDYNTAHRDHLHLDEAARSGWGVCS